MLWGSRKSFVSVQGVPQFSHGRRPPDAATGRRAMADGGYRPENSAKTPTGARKARPKTSAITGSSSTTDPTTMPRGTEIATGDLVAQPDGSDQDATIWLNPGLPADHHEGTGSRPRPSSSTDWSAGSETRIQPSPDRPNALPGATATRSCSRKCSAQAATSPPLAWATSTHR